MEQQTGVNADFLRPVLIGVALLSGFLLLIKWQDEQRNLMQARASGETAGEAEIPAGADAPAATAALPATQRQPATQQQDIGLELQTAGPDQELAAATDPQAQADGRYHSFGTPTLRLRIDLDGGGIDRVELPTYPQELDASDRPVRLLDRLGPYRYYTRQGYQTADRSQLQLRFEVVSDATNAQGRRELVLRHSEPGRLTLTRRMSVAPGDFLVRVEDEIANTADIADRGAQPLSLYPFAATYHNGESPPGGLFLAAPSYTGGAYFSSDGNFEKYDFDDMRDQALRQSVRGGWASLVQHYFVSAWIPDPQQEHLYQMRYSSSMDLYVLGLASPRLAVAPGAAADHATSIWFGPKDQKRLAELSKGLDLTVDYGWLWWIGQPIYTLISWIQGVVGNWGLAIILFTALLKLAIYPLSAAGFRSMAKMRLLAPEMERLKAIHGEDRQRMAQETMALYKREGVNPLGGCLPLLIPMPIFLAFYWVLLETVELRHAPFALWIQDLSARDPYFVLPVLMGLSMWLTQRMSPTPANMDPVMARVMQFMPLIFTLFMLAFPAGLVLYWLVNNVFSVAQQYWIQRSVAKAAAG